jgi:hypothetical protein
MLAHYLEGKESVRLLDGNGPLEFARTQELILRFFPPLLPPYTT